MGRGARRIAWLVAAAGAMCVQALVGCEALLNVGSLTERSGEDGGGRDATGSSGGMDSGGFESRPDSSPIDSGSSSGADTGSAADSGNDGACTVPPEAPCAVDPQCGCPSGEKCDLPNGNVGCVAFGTSAVGEICTTSTDCVPGATCTNGVCHPFCATPGAPCPPIQGTPVGECLENGNPVQGFLCPLTCTLAPNSCKFEASCAAVSLADGGLFSDCEGPGSGASGDSCSADTDCAKGLGCETQTQTCYQWCELSPGTTTCSTGSCNGPAAAVINGISYGFCY